MASSEEQREVSLSSDEFCNKAGTDNYFIHEIANSDENCIQISDEPIIQPKKRGRPRKNIATQLNPGDETSNKSHPQQLRKTFPTKLNQIGKMNKIWKKGNKSYYVKPSSSNTAKTTMPTFTNVNLNDEANRNVDPFISQTNTTEDTEVINANEKVNSVDVVDITKEFKIQPKRRGRPRKADKLRTLQQNQASKADQMSNNLQLQQQRKTIASGDKEIGATDKSSKKEEELSFAEENHSKVAKASKESKPTFTVVNVADITDKTANVLIPETDVMVYTDSTIDENIDAISTENIVTTSIDKILKEDRPYDDQASFDSSFEDELPTFTVVNINDIINKKINILIPPKDASSSEDDNSVVSITNDAATPLTISSDETDTANEESGAAPKNTQLALRMAANTCDSFSDKEEFYYDSDTGQPKFHNCPGNKRLWQNTTSERVTITPGIKGIEITTKTTQVSNWYIMKPPEERPAVKIPKILEISLFKIISEVDDIRLPSDRWTNEITLTKLTTSNIKQSSTYTGDLGDQKRVEVGRAKYQPTCVMFYRSVNDIAKSDSRIDRSVTFKNKTFVTNIDGRNVELLAAPTTIANLKDVEILLDLMDYLTLDNDLVECI